MSSVVLHIGYSKAGSTYLKNWFTEHPDILLGGFKNYEEFSSYVELQTNPNIKQQHVLSNHIFHLFNWNFNIPIDKWLKQDNLYDYQLRMCHTLHSLFPQARILIITRGFSSMLQSFYSEYIRTGGLLSYIDLIETHGESFLLKAYNYNFLVSHYIEKYKKENIIVLPYELLRDNSELFLRKLESNLSINSYNFTNENINSSLDLKLIFWYRQLSIKVFKLSRIFGLRLGNILYSKYTFCLLNGSFNFLLKPLSKFCKKREIINVSEKELNKFKNNSAVLKHFSEFEKYYEEYLIKDA